MDTAAQMTHRPDMRDWRTWLTIALRACLYTLPFLLVTLRFHGMELGGFAFFPLLLPVAAYRVLRSRPGATVRR